MSSSILAFVTLSLSSVGCHDFVFEIDELFVRSTDQCGPENAQHILWVVVFSTFFEDFRGTLAEVHPVFGKARFELAKVFLVGVFAAPIARGVN